MNPNDPTNVPGPAPTPQPQPGQASTSGQPVPPAPQAGAPTAQPVAPEGQPGPGAPETPSVSPAPQPDPAVPAQQPVSPQASGDSVAPHWQDPVQPAAPVTPQQPPQPASGVPPVVPPAPGGQPQAFAPGAASTPAPSGPKIPKKLIMLGAAVIGGLVAIGLIVWALFAFVFNSGVALEEHTGDNFTVLVPETFEKGEERQGMTVFTAPEAEDAEEGATRSTVQVGEMSLSAVTALMSKEDLIKSYDESFTEDKINDAVNSDSDEVRNFKKSDDDYQGFEARRISFDGYKDDKKVGNVHMLMVFGEKSLYMVQVMSGEDTPKLEKSANKIIDSLKIDE